jgi:hypothetical protein
MQRYKIKRVNQYVNKERGKLSDSDNKNVQAGKACTFNRFRGIFFRLLCGLFPEFQRYIGT